MPVPIQLGAITDRLRKFFRIRGRISLTLDEVIAPVVLVQDLTVGPYQAGVTPAAGALEFIIQAPNASVYALLLNDKAGSITPVLGKQFDGRSFGVTWMEIQNQTDVAIEALLGLTVELVSRANIVAAGVPNSSAVLFSIQDNDGSLSVPVEQFGFNTGTAPGSVIWRGILGDNTNTLGTRRTLEPLPNITIGPDDVLIFRSSAPIGDQDMLISVRGFYQEQPS